MVNTVKLKEEIIANNLTQKNVYEQLGLSKRQWMNRMNSKKFSSDEIFGMSKMMGDYIIPIFFED